MSQKMTRRKFKLRLLKSVKREVELLQMLALPAREATSKQRRTKNKRLSQQRKPQSQVTIHQMKAKKTLKRKPQSRLLLKPSNQLRNQQRKKNQAVRAIVQMNQMKSQRRRLQLRLPQQRTDLRKLLLRIHPMKKAVIVMLKF